jgi:hypothetical protein
MIRLIVELTQRELRLAESNPQTVQQRMAETSRKKLDASASYDKQKRRSDAQIEELFSKG